MDWLYIPDVNSSEEDQNEVKEISSLVSAFAKDNPVHQESIKDFPVGEGFAETAKEDTIFTIVHDFIAWLKNQPDKHGDINYNTGKITPSRDAD